MRAYSILPGGLQKWFVNNKIMVVDRSQEAVYNEGQCNPKRQPRAQILAGAKRTPELGLAPQPA